jgi:outer membrane murein-binding lipoprotein Lpp
MKGKSTIISSELVSSELSQEQIIQQINHKYRQAMDLRFTINIRVAKRMTIIIRGLIAVFAVLLISFFLLISVLTQHTNEINDTINTINLYFTSMTEDMHAMRLNVASMEQDMSVMPIIMEEVATINGHVNTMGKSIESLAQKMHTINQHMSSMDEDITAMSTTLLKMDNTVHYIDIDVDNLSSPMKSY